MTERFEKYFAFLKKWEGTYANDPTDRGGETFMGICRKYYPELQMWQSLDKLPTKKEKKVYEPTDYELYEIRKVYWTNYYNKVKADYFDNESLALQLADFANGSGTITAIKQLQKMLGITVDGIVGQQTIGTANAQPRVAERFREIRLQFYQNIVNRDPTQVKFIKGWNNRANDCGRV